MRYLWHATSLDCALNIVKTGIQPGTSGIIYMCEEPLDAAKFLYIRGVKEIVVFKIKVYKNEEEHFFETFDHSEKFFKCRCFGTDRPIPIDRIVRYEHYILNTNKEN